MTLGQHAHAWWLQVQEVCIALVITVGTKPQPQMEVRKYKSECCRPNRTYPNSWNPVYLFYSKKDRRHSYNWRKTLIKIIIQAVNLPNKENWEYQEIKVLAKLHEEDQKLLFKRLILSWPKNRTLEYLEILWSLFWDILGKGFVQSRHNISVWWSLSYSDLGSLPMIAIGYWKREWNYIIYKLCIKRITR